MGIAIHTTCDKHDKETKSYRPPAPGPMGGKGCSAVGVLLGLPFLGLLQVKPAHHHRDTREAGHSSYPQQALGSAGESRPGGPRGPALARQTALVNAHTAARRRACCQRFRRMHGQDERVLERAPKCEQRLSSEGGLAFEGLRGETMGPVPFQSQLSMAHLRPPAARLGNSPLAVWEPWLGLGEAAEALTQAGRVGALPPGTILAPYGPGARMLSWGRVLSSQSQGYGLFFHRTGSPLGHRLCLPDQAGNFQQAEVLSPPSGW